MKALKIAKTTILILLVGVITFLSFFGLKITKNGETKNIFPDYKFGMEFAGGKRVNLTVDRTTKNTIIYDKEGNVVEPEEGKEYKEEDGYTTITTDINSGEVLNQDNYNRIKNILIDRLEAVDASQYVIRLDKDSGNMSIEIPNNAETENIASLLSVSGSFELLDFQTWDVLLNKSDLEKAEIMYGASETDTTTNLYLQLQLNEQGTQKLSQISKTYIQTNVEVTDDEGKATTETQTNYVLLMIDGQIVNITYFGEEITDGKLTIPMYSSADSKELQTYVDSLNYYLASLNNDEINISYNIEQEDFEKSMDDYTIRIYVIGLVIVYLAVLIFNCIKFRAKGVITMLMQIGYLAVLLIVLRWTNVVITVEGIAGITISMILNYLLVYMMLNDKNDLKIGKTLLDFTIKTIPVYIVAIIFTFSNLVNVNSFGMTIFWGSVLLYIYNYLITWTILKTLKKED